jgi:hypothetical protein
MVNIEAFLSQSDSQAFLDWVPYLQTACVPVQAHGLSKDVYHVDRAASHSMYRTFFNYNALPIARW